MARIIYLLSPIIKHPLPVSFSVGKMSSQLLSHLLAWFLVALSFYYSYTSNSTLLLGVTTIQLGICFLILLETILKKVKTGPLECLAASIVLFLTTGGIMIDAYWHLTEADMSRMKNPEVEVS